MYMKLHNSLASVLHYVYTNFQLTHLHQAIAMVTTRIRKKAVLFLFLAGFAFVRPFTQPLTAQPLNTAKPWTYWWWMGSGVTREGITSQLEQFAKAGLGGVHIIPIYGVKGYENQFKPFLGPEWLAHFQFTVQEAKRLRLGVDLTTGTGWPFGGPNVTPAMGAKQWKLADGKLTSVPTRQQVKRPAPGGAGLVVDPFDKQAVRQYLTRFDSTLIPLAEKPRAMYNDSYEIYGANWTDQFLPEFRKRRGYDLNSQQAAFLDTTIAEASVRVRQDYYQTIAELLLDQFTTTWTGWARRNGYLTRNQAHGSPGNLLDLYALADIPETESFGTSKFPIPGLRVDPDYEPDRFGNPSVLAMKLASSPAHLLGKPLVSSETTTWLANHFKVSLSQIKPQIDELFTAGINHIFYHGTTYSPPGEAWPGWLFYASTNYSPSTHFWNEYPELNAYVERSQARLQASRPDNDLLVYFPMQDIWALPGKSQGGIQQLDVHHVERWLSPQPFGKLCEQFRQQGFTFDAVSDAQLTDLRVVNGRIVSKGGSYRIIVVPDCRYMPEGTMQQLARLAGQGATIVFEKNLPQLAPGFRDAARRNASVKTIGQALAKRPGVRVAADVPAMLTGLKVLPEALGANGLSFIRKKADDAALYFVANLNNRFTEGWVTVNRPVSQRFDPLTNKTEMLITRKKTDGSDEVWLRLLPGQSCFLSSLVSSDAWGSPSIVPKVQKTTTFRPLMQLSGPWSLSFGAGKPALSGTRTLAQLTSWPALGDSAVYFSGKAMYTTTFDLPAAPQAKTTYRLDLGDVRETARVWINGHDAGLAWSIPFELEIPAGWLKQTGNQLKIEVTNLSANYMRLRDKQQPAWKKFYDINIVDITYKPFDAARWEPMPSGLLGPVRVLAND